MKILFIHLTRDETIEYTDHEICAEYTPYAQIESVFVRQAKVTGSPLEVGSPRPGVRWYTADFGRASDVPPGRLRRAWLMARRLPWAAWFLLKLVRTEKPDMVYTSQQKFDILTGWIISALTGIPRVVHLHYNAGPWLGRLVMTAIRRAPYLLAVSQYARQLAIEQGVPGERIAVVTNPADIQRIDIEPDKTYIARTFFLPEDTPVIVSAGRLDPYKGHEATLRAFARVLEQKPEARLIICGAPLLSRGTNYADQLQQMALEMGLEGRAIFAGKRADLPQILHSASIFCLATENEVFGMVFPEAMMARLPVVALRSGGVPEVVLHGITGLLSDPGDDEGLAHNILILLNDRQQAQKLGQAGRAWARQLVSPPRVSEKWGWQLLDWFDLHRQGKKPQKKTTSRLSRREVG
jgi:glycosyltransferase involved in cell wall biosynthesis